MAQFTVLIRYIPGGAAEKWDSRSPDRYLKLGPPEYEAVWLPTRVCRSAEMSIKA